MRLRLGKPIVFFDLETTGLDILNDHIVEISLVKLMPDGKEIIKTRRINPGIPIPPEATAVHHITDEDVANEPTFRQIAKSLAEIFADSDIAGFNSNRFDIPMLDQEFHNAGVEIDFSKARFIDVQTIFHKKEPRNLVAAYKFYCGKDLEAAHSAAADTYATYEVLKAQLEKYPDLPDNVAQLSDFASNNKNVDYMGRLIYNDQKQEVINFGKYKGRLAEEVLKADPSYYQWIQQGQFPQNTKQCFTRIVLRSKTRNGK